MGTMEHVVRAPATETRSRIRLRVDWPWTISLVLAAGALLLAFFLPLWSMTLLAPQYPGGLDLTAYGTRMEGDLPEINTLNHYIGVAAIEPDSVLELKLFPFVLFPMVAALAVAAFLQVGRWVHVALAAAVWMFPIGLLVDMQYWLYVYGHDLAPDAPMRIDPFTPKVVGTTKVINFESQTMVSSGFWAMFVAALLVTLGPWFIRFIRESWANTGETRVGAIAALVMTAGLGGAALLPAQTAGAAEPPDLAELVARAEPGDTIVVPPGTYEGPLVIDKPLTLVGEGRPVIDGGGSGTVVTIAAEGVTLRGFAIRNSGRDVSGEPAGIRVTAGGAVIEDNVLREVLYGIVLQDSGGHLVRNNDISSRMEFSAERRGHAIYLWHTSDNVVTGNRVDGAKDGVFIGFGTDTLVEGNTITHVRYGIHYMYADRNVFRANVFRHNIAGAALMYSRVLTLEDNEFSHNASAASGYGLLMKDVDDVEMRGNRVFQNRVGITMEGAPHTPGSTVVIEDNFIGHNQVAIELFTNTDASFSGNSFVGNLRQVESRGGVLAGRNDWSPGGRGNYWDDYRGYDADGNGIGDRPYSYATAFNDLARDEPALRAFAFTPAQAALDLAANWFAGYKPEPAVTDDHPLISPAVSLGETRSWSDAAWVVAAMAPLVALPLAAFRISRRTFSRRWARCFA